jgi:hypothetical protein
VGKQPPKLGNLEPGLCGSGFIICVTGICELLNLTPVTCCTICLKFAGSAVMNVVWVRFDARDFRFETFPELETGTAFLCLFIGRVVSWSEEPETLETVGVEMKSDSETTALLLVLMKMSLAVAPESDFWSALVRVSVSRE